MALAFISPSGFNISRNIVDIQASSYLVITLKPYSHSPIHLYLLLWILIMRSKISLDSPSSCVVKLLHFNFSASPFHLNDELPLCNYSIFNCSGVTNDDVGSLGCSATPASVLITVRNTETLDVNM
ncbi:hypothetical protein HAX54_048170 [Datura stramonium]|uniref:Uncharacterized protein n=1 Tax=Datura stramonium TaxID=4076 RepID=A0ABS8STD2_DATST|nr:hypothetical protein [Datura stramonium]